jgi:dihydrofolate synthase / folylpolyglutamate synthase
VDGAVSSHPAVRAQLARLERLRPGSDLLGLARISALLARLGNPERALPPVFHVAGTNGKGSTCAFLRAAAEAAGLNAHVYTSPHLVRFNERIRLAGRLIEDAALADLLAETLDAAGDMELSFFEATTAAAFLAFSRTPADLAIVEVGLGGRLDATNVLARPAMCGIAALGLDHQALLGDTIADIAGEKAGIAKAGVPLVTFSYEEAATARIAAAADAAGAQWLPRGEAWDFQVEGKRLRYRDAQGRLDLPVPRLSGAHQAANAALAVAMLRHQGSVKVPDDALAPAMAKAVWPARLQRLGPGPLRARLPEGAELWLDGAHNPDAAAAVAAHLRGCVSEGRPLHLVCGLLANKDLAGLLAPFAGFDLTLRAVPVEGHEHHAPDALAAAARAIGIAAEPAVDVAAALDGIAAEAGPPPFVLVMGSLYLAGRVLAANDQAPD